MLNDINENSAYNLIRELYQRKLKISTAESCTGGLISKLITDVPGASKVFECGICSYSDEIKQKILNVKSETLEHFTAVSAQTAIEMATGVRILSDSDISISTTGFAGPKTSGCTDPVGLVYIGLSHKNFSRAVPLQLFRGIDDDRDFIRNQAANKAISLALELVKNLPTLKL